VLYQLFIVWGKSDSAGEGMAYVFGETGYAFK